MEGVQYNNGTKYDLRVLEHLNIRVLGKHRNTRNLTVITVNVLNICVNERIISDCLVFIQNVKYMSCGFSQICWCKTALKEKSALLTNTGTISNAHQSSTSYENLCQIQNFWKYFKEECTNLNNHVWISKCCIHFSVLVGNVLQTFTLHDIIILTNEKQYTVLLKSVRKIVLQCYTPSKIILNILQKLIHNYYAWDFFNRLVYLYNY